MVPWSDLPARFVLLPLTAMVPPPVQDPHVHQHHDTAARQAPRDQGLTGQQGYADPVTANPCPFLRVKNEQTPNYRLLKASWRFLFTFS